MYKVICLVATIILINPNLALSIEGLSANIAGSSNYLWRGVTQTNDQAAVSGGIDYEHSNGFYIGTWVSNVDFETEASYELDVYGGYYSELSELISYDIGYNYYAFPDETDANIDLGEVFVNVYIGNFSLGAASLVYSGSDAFDKGQENDWLYLSADTSLDISNELSLNFHIGSFSGDSIKNWMDKNYLEYFISLSKSGFTFMISDTDLPDDDVLVSVSYQLEFDL